MALIDKLSAIGNAIRSKTGTTEKMTLSEMPAAIASIEGGGGGASIPESALTITGNCDYKFYNKGWNWFLEEYGSNITTDKLESCSYLFYNNSIETIPFEFNFNSSAGTVKLEQMFGNCRNLKEIPAFNNTIKVSSVSYMFYCCYKLRELPTGIETCLHSYILSNANSVFGYCCSLREIPPELLYNIYSDFSSTYGAYGYTFYSCFALNKVNGLYPINKTVTSDLFSSTFAQCNRVSDITFAVQEDEAPYSRKWSNQTIDLTNTVGYGNPGNDNNIISYNSGITKDKKVTDAVSYESLKNDADWYTLSVDYSRYNHDSAVRTINSLPDCSAGSSNVIKFKGAAGALTDGGAINTLTGEEIAVAAVKGWTVSLV